MDAILEWLSKNQLLLTTLVIACILLIITLIILYSAAFLQGREVSFWPAKIGERPEKKQAASQANANNDIALTKSPQFLLSTYEIDTIEPFTELINRSNDLLFCGVALGFAAQRHRGQLLERLQAGARLRFLLLDPHSPDVGAIADTFEVSTEKIKADILFTLTNLEVLRKKTEAIKNGSIEVRLLSQEPSFSFVLSNAYSKDGLLRGSLRIFGHSSSERPYFLLKASDKWFTVFVDSCEDLWKNSKVSDISRAEAPEKYVQMAGVVLYRVSEGEKEVLVITARTAPSKWIFPVGMVEPDEDLQQAAIRECAEESGHIAEINFKLGSIELENGGPIKRMTFFAGCPTREIEVYEKERKRMWVKLSDLKGIIAKDFLPIAHKAYEKIINL